MNRKHLITGLVAAALTGGAIGGVAYAKDHESATNDDAIIANAKLSLSQALATAEQSTGGKAVDAGIEDQDGAVHFEVTVLKDGAHQKVLVDTQTGQVVKTMKDSDDDDRDGNGDKD